MAHPTSRPPDLVWRRPTDCEESDCVEVAFAEAGVLVRNSAHPDGPVLAFDRQEWRAFIAAVAAGQFAG